MDTFNLQATQYSNTFFCLVEGDTIYQADAFGNRKALGKIMDAYNELEQTTTEYYNKLVELGVIVPPKTPEEQNKELQDTLSSITAMMQSMQNEIKELKENGHQCSCADGSENVSKRKGGRSSAAGTADDPGNGE